MQSSLIGARESPSLFAGESLDPEGPDGWIHLDRQGGVVRCDRRFIEVWRLAEDEVAALGAADPVARRALLMRYTLARVQDPETVAAGMERQLGLPGEVTFEDVALKDGRLLERYGAPLRDQAGRIVGRAVSLRDVSTRRRVEVELRERARQQEAIAELGRAAISSPDLDRLLQEALRSVARTLGADVVHVLELAGGGTSLALRAGTAAGAMEPESLVPPRSPAALAAGQGSTIVVTDVSRERRFAPAGHAVHYGAGVSVVVHGRARPFGVLCTHWTQPRGVTEEEVHFLETVADILTVALARIEAEQELVERERGNRAVFEASLDGLLTFDEAGMVSDANPAAAHIFGRSLSDTLGRPVFSLFGEGTLEKCQANFRSLLTTGRCSGEMELRFADRPPRTVEYAGVAGILPGRHLVVLRDTTERRQMQARLAVADRMVCVGTLAAGVAHELNNPLSYVLANLEYVAETLHREAGSPGTEAGPGGELVRAVQEARAGAARMRGIIQDLRTFSRGDEGRVGPVELGPVLESCVSMAWNVMKHRARFVRELEQVPFVHGNEARLGQVFLNLLVNAAQAIPEGEVDRNTIRLATRRLADGRVSVEVTDSGSGMAPEIQGRIFDPFFTTKPVGEGTGLGLSICHSIVASLGGSIEVDSAPGCGATFRVLLLPAADLPPAPPPMACADGRTT